MKVSAYDWIKNISENNSLGLNSKVKDKFDQMDWVPEDHILEGIYKACVEIFKSISPEIEISRKIDITNPSSNEKIGFEMVIRKTIDAKIVKGGISLERDKLVYSTHATNKKDKIYTGIATIVIVLILSGKILAYTYIVEEGVNGYEVSSRSSNFLRPRELQGAPRELEEEYRKIKSAEVNKWILPYSGFNKFWECPDIDTAISSIKKVSKAYKIAVDALDLKFKFAKYLDNNFE